MKRKDYQKPTMQVFMMKQQQQLLVGSSNGTRNPYGDPITDDWG